MDLHVYRNSQDRWHDLRSAARDRGAVLALKAVTLDELAQPITPDVKTATAGQRLVILQDAIAELKGTRMRSNELRELLSKYFAAVDRDEWPAAERAYCDRVECGFHEKCWSAT